jgi:hypothetical protein
MTRKGKKLIRQVNLGRIPSSYISTMKPVLYCELEDFVKNDIKDGPQIVSIPVPPYRHAFFVDVQPEIIMVSDWIGEREKTLHVIPSNNYKTGWKQYSEFMTLLEKKYERQIQFYPVDEKLYNLAKIQHDNNGGGGCSHYIFSWLPTREEYIHYQI